jgi:hypothetical protein
MNAPRRLGLYRAVETCEPQLYAMHRPRREQMTGRTGKGIDRWQAAGATSFLVVLCVLCAVPATVRAAWTPPVNVSGPPTDSVSGADVAMDANGDAVVMWRRSGGIQARVRRANGRLTPIQSIAPPGTTSIYGDCCAFAVNAEGDSAFVWERGAHQGYVMGRIRQADGTLGPPLTVAQEPNLNVVRVGIDASGRAVFSWSSSHEPGVVKARALSPSGNFGPVQRVAAGVGGGSGSDWTMGVASTGLVVFGWGRYDTDAVYARAMSPANHLGQPRRVSPADRRPDLIGTSVGFSMNAVGDAVFTWNQPTPSGSSEVFIARVRYADGVFGPRRILHRGGTLQSSISLSSSGEAVVCLYPAGAPPTLRAGHSLPTELSGRACGSDRSGTRTPKNARPRSTRRETRSSRGTTTAPHGCMCGASTPTARWAQLNCSRALRCCPRWPRIRPAGSRRLGAVALASRSGCRSAHDGRDACSMTVGRRPFSETGLVVSAAALPLQPLTGAKVLSQFFPRVRERFNC